MSAPAASSWTCPQCGRRVPGREPRCHCGLERGTVPAAEAVRRAGPRPRPVREARTRVLLATVVMAASGVGLYAVTRPRSRDLPPPASAGPPSPGPFRYPALPVLAAEDARAVARPPARTTGETEWARATALLAARLGKIGAATEALRVAGRPFAATCLAVASGASPSTSGPEELDWLASLRTAQRVRSAVLLTSDGTAADCEDAWKSLVARADALRSELEATESLARASGVRPDHWRKLLAVHRLEVWGAY